MALTYQPSEEQLKNIAARLANIFGLPNGDNIREDWSIEQWAGGESALLKIGLSMFITCEEANALISGVSLQQGGD